MNYPVDTYNQGYTVGYVGQNQGQGQNYQQKPGPYYKPANTYTPGTFVTCNRGKYMGQGSASKYHRTGCFICHKPQESPVPGCTSNYHLDIYRNGKDAKQPYEQAGEKKLCRLCGNNQHDAVGCFIYPTQVPCSAPCSLCKNIRYCFMQKKGAYIEKKYQVGIRSQPQTPRRPCKKK